MKRIALAAVGIALIGLSAWAADAETAKAYLAEVRQHLLNSYIDRANVRRADLEAAAVAALRRAPDHKDLAGVDEATREALKKALSDARTLNGALEAAAKAANGDGFPWLTFADHAARAMVAATGDPYSRILTRDEFTKLLRMIQDGWKEDSIGLAVRPSEKGFRVAYVQYGYAAYDEGIEMGDEIVEIDGKPIAGVPPEDVAERLKVRPGGAITLGVRRRDGEDVYRFRLVQRGEPGKDVQYAMLGDGVGYLRLAMFGTGLPSEVRMALRALRKDGMSSLIVDLRNNPGGALDAATAVADQFLPQGLVITTVEMDYKPSVFGIEIPFIGGDREYRTKVRTDFERLPMRVLVNRASASASELLAGTLQDHGRAKIVGETTYGKGVGQSPIPLTGSGGGMLPERFLYLTVLRYFLPSGRSINGTGVVPDAERGTGRPSPEEFAARWEVRTSKGLSSYLDAQWRDHQDTLRQLAWFDDFDAAKYPGFDDLFEALRTTLDRDAVRGELRQAIRRRVAAEDRTRYVYDLQTDVQLQSALVDLLDSRK